MAIDSHWLNAERRNISAEDSVSICDMKLRRSEVEKRLD